MIYWLSFVRCISEIKREEWNRNIFQYLGIFPLFPSYVKFSFFAYSNDSENIMECVSINTDVLQWHYFDWIQYVGCIDGYYSMTSIRICNEYLLYWKTCDVHWNKLCNALEIRYLVNDVVFYYSSNKKMMFCLFNSNASSLSRIL